MEKEIRNYRFACELKSGKCNDPAKDHTEVIEAYDLNEALVQFGIKYQDKPFVKIIEIIPFKYIEEQKPVTEQKKEVHVKPNIIRK